MSYKSEIIKYIQYDIIKLSFSEIFYTYMRPYSDGIHDQF